MRLFVPSTGKFANVPDNKLSGFLKQYPDAIPAEEGITPIPSTPRVVAPAPSTKPQTAPVAAEAPETTLGGMLGGAVRGAGPVATGALLGALTRSPKGVAAGAGAGALWQMLADPAMGFINYAAGTNFPMPTKALEDFLTELGVPEPDTAAERVVQQAASGMAAAMGGVGVARAAAPAVAPVSPTVTQRVLQTMAAEPGMQAVAGGAGGAASQIAAESGASLPVQMMAGVLGGAGAGAAMSRTPTPTVARGRERLRQLAQEQAEKARLATAGPGFVEDLESGLIRGVDQPEALRIMRELDLSRGVMSPTEVAKRAGVKREEAGAIIGRIYSEIDEQAGGYMKRAKELRAEADAKMATLDPERAKRIKAAEDAKRRADDMQKQADDAARFLADAEREVRKTSATARPIPPAPVAEKGITRLPSSAEAMRQEAPATAAREALEEALFQIESGKVISSAIDERQTTRPFDILTGKKGEPVIDRSISLPYRMTLAAEESAQNIPYAQERARLAEEAAKTVPTAAVPEPGIIPIQSAVSATKAINAQRREAKMMADAAKKARAEAEAADDALKSLETVGEKEARDTIKKAEQMEALAGKRRVSGKAIANALRSQAKSLLAELELQDPKTAMGSSTGRLYQALIKEADKAEAAGDRSLSAAFATVDKLRPEAKWDKVPSGGRPEVLAAQSEVARSGTRLLQDEMAKAAEEGLSPLSDIFEQEIARIGRGEPVATPSGREALESARRVYQVTKPLEASAAEEAKRIGKLPLRSQPLAYFGPSMKAAGLEKAESLLAPSSKAAVPLAQQYKESLLGSGVGTAQTFLDALLEMDQSIEPENPEEEMSMVQP